MFNPTIFDSNITLTIGYEMDVVLYFLKKKMYKL